MIEESKKLKVLHTSDWHIGRTLCGRKRNDEFEAFLTWMVGTIQQEKVDVLLIAGDIFDTSTPNNQAQQLYYRFLCSIAASSCRHIVVIAGNHDSPSFLNAPKELLRVLDVHVIGSKSENCEDEVIVLSNKDGTSELIVCAVPYLRDRDIRVAEAGESIEDKGQKLIKGMRNHYAEVTTLAELKREEVGMEIPIVAMGHLFTAGGQTLDGDGVRELYIGSLAHVGADVFPDSLDYVALGHLHMPQKVNGSEVMRYSGSPLPMGFGEAQQKKSVCLVEFVSTQAKVQLIEVPVFQKLEHIKGNWGDILARIRELSLARSQAWLEVIYEGEEVVSDLRERIDRAVSGSGLEVLRVKNNRINEQVLKQICDEEALEDLEVNDVFERCLLSHNVPEDQRNELLQVYNETVLSIEEEDANA